MKDGKITRIKHVVVTWRPKNPEKPCPKLKGSPPRPMEVWRWSRRPGPARWCLWKYDSQRNTTDHKREAEPLEIQLITKDKTNCEAGWDLRDAPGWSSSCRSAQAGCKAKLSQERYCQQNKSRNCYQVCQFATRATNNQQGFQRTLNLILHSFRPIMLSDDIKE